jgi:hypothetical protein
MSKPTFSVGPFLPSALAPRVLVYSMAYGDQPAIICELVDWVRACGFELTSAGKGMNFEPHCRYSTPDKIELVRLGEAACTAAQSVIAAMTDLIRFFSLGDIFTAPIKGNLALAAAVRGGLRSRFEQAGPSTGAGLLLEVPFVLLTAVLIFSVVTRPSNNPAALCPSSRS